MENQILKSGRYFSEYLTILTDLSVDISNWVESTSPMTDELLDAIDFEEPMIVTEILVNSDSLVFTNTSSNDTFDPVKTIIKLNTEQLENFLIRIQSLY